MADIYYPHDYLPLPLQSDLSFKPVSPFLRTNLTSGRARQRRLYTSVPTQVPLKWFFKKQGIAQYFEAWYRDRLTDGESWFYMKVKTPLGVELYKCRFTDIYEGPMLLAGKFWQYTATIELWERPIIPQEWTDFPDYVVNSDIIDLAMNREWPES